MGPPPSLGAPKSLLNPAILAIGRKLCPACWHHGRWHLSSVRILGPRWWCRECGGAWPALGAQVRQAAGSCPYQAGSTVPGHKSSQGHSWLEFQTAFSLLFAPHLSVVRQPGEALLSGGLSEGLAETGMGSRTHKTLSPGNLSTHQPGWKRLTCQLQNPHAVIFWREAWCLASISRGLVGTRSPRTPPPPSRQALRL